MDCEQCRVRVAAYQQNILPPDERKKVEKHVKKCASCRQLFTRYSSDEALNKGDSDKRRSANKRKLLIGVGVLIIGITLFLMNGIWNSNRGSLEEINQFGMDTKVMAVSESNNIKITVTHAIADEFQSVIYYEIEDLSQDRELWIEPQANLKIDSGEKEVWERRSFDIRNTTPMNDYENQGRISLPPIKEDQAKVTLKLSELVEYDEKINPYMARTDSEVKINGEWQFTFPIEKKKSRTHELNQEKKAGDLLLRINKVTVAPTVTLISYQMENQSNKGHAYIAFDELKTAEGNYKVNQHAYSIIQNRLPVEFDGNWVSEIIPFESVYFSDPENLEVIIDRVMKQVSVEKEFPIDAKKEGPQTIDFQGGEITIKNIQLGKTSSLEMEHKMTAHRQYEILNFDIRTEPESHTVPVENEWIFMTEDGNSYTQEELLEMGNTVPLRGRRYFTHSKVTMEDPAGTMGEKKLIPNSLYIYSYQITEFPDDSFSIDLKK